MFKLAFGNFTRTTITLYLLDVITFMTYNGLKLRPEEWGWLCNI